MFNSVYFRNSGADVGEDSFDLARRLYDRLDERLDMLVGVCDDLKRAVDSNDIKKLKKVVSDMYEFHFNESSLQDINRWVSLVYKEVK